MKKVLIALLAAAALFAVASCGGKKNTPATQLIDKMEVLMNSSLAMMENPGDVTDEQMEAFQKTQDEIEAFAEANKDYVLTDADKQAFKEFAQRVSEKMGRKLTEKDLKEIDEAKTLGDLADL